MSDETTQNAAPELSAEVIAATAIAAAAMLEDVVQTPPDPAKVALHRRVSNDFAAHPPKTPEAKALFDEIAAQCEGLAHYLIEVCPGGRELSLALTDLESAKRNAIAAVACHQDD